MTGGASGLGRAVSSDLAAHGAYVILADVDRDAGEELSKALHPNAIFIDTDVTDPVNIDRALHAGKTHFGGFHGSVNCAGILVSARMLRKDGGLFDSEQFRACLEVNLFGTFNSIRSAVSVLSENSPNPAGERGVIVNTASIAAFEGQVGQAAYAAAKAGIIGMALPLARELGAFGIRVMTVAPGIFDTALFAGLSDALRTELEQQVPFPKRLGKPEEFAMLVRHIIENPMLNGGVIRLDGGLRLNY